MLDPINKIHEARKACRHGLSGKAPAWQPQGPEFKLQYQKKQKRKSVRFSLRRQVCVRPMPAHCGKDTRQWSDHLLWSLPLSNLGRYYPSHTLGRYTQDLSLRRLLFCFGQCKERRFGKQNTYATQPQGPTAHTACLLILLWDRVSLRDYLDIRDTQQRVPELAKQWYPKCNWFLECHLRDEVPANP
jgi:hypothetical protein